MGMQSGGVGGSTGGNTGGGNTGGGVSGGSSTSGGGADSPTGASSTAGGGSESNGSDNASNRGLSDNDNKSTSSNGVNTNAADLGGYFGDLATPSGAPSIDNGSGTDDSKSRDAAPANGQMDEEANYSIDTGSLSRNGVTDPGLTPEQSQSLATSAAVMDGFAFSPANATPTANDAKAEEEGIVDRAWGAVVGTAELTGGIAVGALERAGSLIAEVPGAAWEGVNMVNDAAGTVLDTAVGWTGIDAFEGHAQRNAARGQAMVDGITSIPGQVSNGWNSFENNWDTGNYYSAGKQIGSLGLDVATVAVPASKLGVVGKVDDMVPNAPASGIAVRSADELPDTVFRGDSRPFSEIEDAVGFQPRGSSTDLHDYALNNTPSVFVGTTPNVDRAVDFATSFGTRDGYVYAIDPRKGGIDVNASLKADSPFPIEQEIAFPGGIPLDDIKGAWPVDRDGWFGTSSQLNTDYYRSLDRDNE